MGADSFIPDFLISLIFLSPEIQTLHATLASVGTGCVAASQTSNSVHHSELLPTIIRYMSLWLFCQGPHRSFSANWCLLRGISGEGSGTPLQYSCLEKSHGRRSLVGCSPWGHEEPDMTEQLHFHFSLSCIGEGNGNPLQCSYLENPRDGRAWWAPICGVAQSQTRLKQFSGSSRGISITRSVNYKASVNIYNSNSMLKAIITKVYWNCWLCANYYAKLQRILSLSF